jgi:hypothetical protein
MVMGFTGILPANAKLRHSRRKRAWPAMMIFEFP